MTKRIRWFVGGAALVAASLVGWWAVTRSKPPGLGEPAEMTLFSIDGVRDRGGPLPPGESFHGYPVLGKVEVTDPVGRREVATALRAGLSEREMARACFWPRHGVRVTEGGRTADYLICFECCQLEVYDGGSKKVWTTGRSPQGALNRYLTAAGLPLAPGMAGDKD